MMRVVCLADTHGNRPAGRLPDGDLLIHAGDCTYSGTESEIRRFMDWFGEQPHRHKVMIAGNHDWLFERDSQRARALVAPGVVYLEDSGAEIEGLRIWGSPVQPRFNDFAFNRDRGADIARHWAQVPSGLDILVTHGPPKGVQDWDARGHSLGCFDLLQRLLDVRPRLHVCGHIHAGYGRGELDGIVVVNAAICDDALRVVNDPIVVDLT